MAYFAPYIDETGIHMPTYEDRLQDLCDKYRSIFGQDAALDPAVPDYQLLSVFAKALDDTSAYVLSAYNSRNPAYATDQALDLLLPVMAISCFGYLPEDLDFVFNPLATVTAEEAEELAGKLSDRVEKLYSAGLLTYEEARSELKTVGEKYAAYSGIDPDAEQRRNDWNLAE